MVSCSGLWAPVPVIIFGGFCNWLELRAVLGFWDEDSNTIFHCSGVNVSCRAETWTAVNGKEVEAEFVSNSDGQVSLKMKTGKVFKVPLNSLSKEDQNF